MSMLSRNQKLAIFFIVIFFVASFYFVAIPNNRRVKALKNEIGQLNTDYENYKAIEKELSNMVGKQNNYLQRTNEMLKVLPPSLEQENIIVQIKKLRAPNSPNFGGISFTKIGPSDYIKIDNIANIPSGNIQQDSTQTQASGNGEQQSIKLEQSNLISMKVNTEYISSYEQIKKAIDLIISQKPKVVLTSIGLNASGPTIETASLSMEFLGYKEEAESPIKYNKFYEKGKSNPFLH